MTMPQIPGTATPKRTDRDPAHAMIRLELVVAEANAGDPRWRVTALGTTGRSQAA